MKLRKLTMPATLFAVALMIASCGGKKANTPQMTVDGNTAKQVKDTTVYGICGDGTSMHSLELVKDDGDTITYMVDADEPTQVLGGMLVGDRMAVIGIKTADGEYNAQTVIDLTTLQGHWTSIDRNFDIKEGGQVDTKLKAETDPWVSWKIVNGKLVFNEKDTFTIDNLGADSLYLENSKGIFTYKRGK